MSNATKLTHTATGATVRTPGRPNENGNRSSNQSSLTTSTVASANAPENGTSSVAASLEKCFDSGDLQGAASVISTHQSQQGDNPEQKRHKPLSTARIQAAGAILADEIPILHNLNIRQEDERVFRYQAAEIILAGQILHDRLTSVSEILHPKGNKWLVKQLCLYGRKQVVSATQTRRAGKSGRTNNLLRPRNSSATTRASEASLPRVRMPIRWQITLPYALLAMVFAAIGTYLVAQVVLDTVEQRYSRQLIETGQLAVDRMVLEEEHRLETLRLLANTQGTADAILAQDAEQLRAIAYPIAVNAGEEVIEILDASGISILSLHQHNEAMTESYSFTRGETTFAQWEIVQRVLNGQVDHGRDKYVGIATRPSGQYLYFAGPVFDSSNTLAGVILLGRSLDRLARDFRESILAQTTFYNPDGQPASSTLLLTPNSLPLAQTNESHLPESGDLSLTRNYDNGSVHYTELIAPWMARSETYLGYLGIALPQNFLVETRNATQIQVLLQVGLGLIIVIATGVLLSRQITRPLLRVVNASRQVAQGDLDVQIEVNNTNQDEIAILAHSFNYMVTGLQEVTERRIREIQLLQALERERELRELKSRFVSMVSHEFRTPLTTILSSSDYLKNYGMTAAPDKQEKHFSRIRSSVRAMTQLMEEVLVIGKTEASQMEFVPEHHDLAELCQNIIDEMQTNAGDKHTIQFSKRGSHFTAYVDARLLRLVFTNLLSNAIKYSPDGGAVEFEILSSSEKFAFRVRDHGIGIPEKDLQRLFEPFHRASNATQISGTGLGMYVTKMAVELHDGQIKVQSKEGTGTTFTIILPTLRESA